MKDLRYAKSNSFESSSPKNHQEQSKKKKPKYHDKRDQSDQTSNKKFRNRKIEALADPKKRRTCFCKRKPGLYKKAHDLAILCNAKVLIVLINENNEIHHYSSDKNIEDLYLVIEKKLKQKEEENQLMKTKEVTKPNENNGIFESRIEEESKKDEAALITSDHNSEMIDNGVHSPFSLQEDYCKSENSNNESFFNSSRNNNNLN